MEEIRTQVPMHTSSEEPSKEEEFDPEKSNLVRHARRELQILGVNEEDSNDIVAVVEAFARISPSGGQAAWLIPILNKLFSFQHLTALSDNPEEWIKVGDETWQSVRNPEAFSTNGGKTYYLLSEVPKNLADPIMHPTMPSEKEGEEE